MLWLYSDIQPTINLSILAVVFSVVSAPQAGAQVLADPDTYNFEQV